MSNDFLSEFREYIQKWKCSILRSAESCQMLWRFRNASEKVRCQEISKKLTLKMTLKIGRLQKSLEVQRLHIVVVLLLCVTCALVYVIYDTSWGTIYTTDEETSFSSTKCPGHQVFLITLHHKKE